MPRRSLVPWPNRFLTLAVLGFVMPWGLSPGLAGLARALDAHLGIEVPDRSGQAQSMETSDLGQQNLPSQFLPTLVQAPAIPDTNPEFGEPEFGEPIPLDDPRAWLQIFGLPLSLVLSLVFLVVPMIPFLLLGGMGLWWLKRWSDQHRPKCDICGVSSTVYTYKKAKPYLNRAQQLEVDLDSVFYSVAVCPQCTRRKVLRFAAPNQLVAQCPRCYYKTMEITQQTTTRKPTHKQEGEAIIHRTCRHCGHTATRTEVLTPNSEGLSEGQEAFLDSDLGLSRLWEGYRDPRDVEPSPPDDGHNAGK